MNVALRAVHEALASSGDPADRWRSFVAELSGPGGPHGHPQVSEVGTALRTAGVGGSASGWLGHLRLLGVIAPDGRLDDRRADEVATALELVADSFEAVGGAASWTPVGTLPRELRALLRPPPLPQTAGVLLELVDAASVNVRLAAPFVDTVAVQFLTDSLLSAGGRGVSVGIVTSGGQGGRFVDMSLRWRVAAAGRLRVTEVATELSPLGSHAKVLVIDDEVGYVGSANLTAAGLGRHVELGVEVRGPQVADLARVFDALERMGALVFDSFRRPEG